MTWLVTFLVATMSETIYCGCGELKFEDADRCLECLYDRAMEQETDDQINHMHGVDD